MAQNQPGSMPQPITITFPSSGQNAMNFDGAANQPLQAFKDRTAITVRWAAMTITRRSDLFALPARDGESVWRLLKDQITDKAYSFDATLIPDGGYQIKVVATDAPSHTPTTR